jgi:hypothetical protein
VNEGADSGDQRVLLGEVIVEVEIAIKSEETVVMVGSEGLKELFVDGVNVLYVLEWNRGFFGSGSFGDALSANKGIGS